MSNQLTEIRKYNAFGGNAARYGFALYRRWETGLQVPLSVFGNHPYSIILKMNPTSIDMEEPAAVEFQPTLGGMYVENRGNLWRDCTISGTTGFAPYIRQAPLSNQATQMSRVANNSGYKDFLTLRNLFRRYAMIKAGDTSGPDAAIASDPTARSQVFMVFMNYKDNEFWVAEPMTFVMPPRRALSYHYNIRMRLVDPFKREYLYGLGMGFTNDPAFGLGVFGDVMAQVGDAIQLAEDVITTVLAIRNAVLLAPATIAAFTESIFATLGGLYEYSKTLVMPPTCTSATLMDAALGTLNIMDGLNRAGIYTVPGGASIMQGMFKAANAFFQLGAAASPFSSPVTSSYEALQRTQVVPTGSAPPPRPPSGYTTDRVLQDETIFDIARRTLGNIERYPEIIVLNNLVPPYFTNTLTNRRAGVLAPGDTILIPSGAQNNTQSYVLGEDVQSPKLSATIDVPELMDGRWLLRMPPPEEPLKVMNRWVAGAWVNYRVTLEDANGTVGVTYVVESTPYTIQVQPVSGLAFPVLWSIQLPAPDQNTLEDNQTYGVDISRLPSGDIDPQLISGLSNFDQAIETKLDTEVGSLPLHPWFGLLTNIGEKVTDLTIMDVNLNATRTLLSDSRVASVSNVEVEVAGDTFFLRAEVQPRVDNRIRVYERGI